MLKRVTIFGQKISKARGTTKIDVESESIYRRFGQGLDWKITQITHWISFGIELGLNGLRVMDYIREIIKRGMNYIQNLFNISYNFLYKL